jgi:hypothetical protein
MGWPEWWDWELELSSHVETRMEDRDFNEVELRLMLEVAEGHSEDWIEGRWVIQTRHGGRAWEVIVDRTLQRDS